MRPDADQTKGQSEASKSRFPRKKSLQVVGNTRPTQKNSVVGADAGPPAPLCYGIFVIGLLGTGFGRFAVRTRHFRAKGVSKVKKSATASGSLCSDIKRTMHTMRSEKQKDAKTQKLRP